MAFSPVVLPCTEADPGSQVQFSNVVVCNVSIKKSLEMAYVAGIFDSTQLSSSLASFWRVGGNLRAGRD